MAIILTLFTTPLTLWIYPSSIRVPHDGAIARAAREAAATAGSEGTEIEKDDNFSHFAGILPSASANAPGSTLHPAQSPVSYRKFTVLLERIEHLPAIMTVAQLLQSPSSPTPGRRSFLPRIDALRLVELSDRTSAVMRGSEAMELLRRDALVKVFEMFGKLNRIVVSSGPFRGAAIAVCDECHRPRKGCRCGYGCSTLERWSPC